MKRHVFHPYCFLTTILFANFLIIGCGEDTPSSPTSSSSEISSSSVRSSSSSSISTSEPTPIENVIHFYDEILDLSDSGIVYKILADNYDDTHQYSIRFIGQEYKDTFSLVIDSVSSKKYYDGPAPYIEAWYYFDNADNKIPTGDLYTAELFDISTADAFNILDTNGMALQAIHSKVENYFGLIDLLNPSLLPTDTLKSGAPHSLRIFPHVDQYQGTLYISDEDEILIGSINTTGGISVVNKDGIDEYYRLTLDKIPDSLLVEGLYFAKFKTRDSNRWSTKTQIYLKP